MGVRSQNTGVRNYLRPAKVICLSTTFLTAMKGLQAGCSTCSDSKTCAECEMPPRCKSRLKAKNTDSGIGENTIPPMT